MEDKKVIVEDFSRIAALSDKRWDHNNHYHKFLCEHIPENCGRSLDIGCGKGDFSRLLAKRSKHVEGIDLTPEMIRRAKELSMDFKNIEYKIEDVMQHDFSENKYGCIVSIATMHHLPLEKILIKIKNSLKPNGVFMVLDLYEQRTFRELISNVVVVPVNIIAMLIKTGKLRPSEEERKAWEEHGKNDRYMTIEEIEEIASRILPGVKIKRHFFWRYSLVWEKS